MRLDISDHSRHCNNIITARIISLDYKKHPGRDIKAAYYGGIKVTAQAPEISILDHLYLQTFFLPPLSFTHFFHI
jgi:hypothetical protein